MATTGAAAVVVMDPRRGAAPERRTWPVAVTSQYEPAGPEALAPARGSLTRAKVAGVVRAGTEAVTT